MIWSSRLIGYAEYCRRAPEWEARGKDGERLAAPPEWLVRGWFAGVDGVLYKYTGDA